jgi:hypothetical protein
VDQLAHEANHQQNLVQELGARRSLLLSSLILQAAHSEETDGAADQRTAEESHVREAKDKQSPVRVFVLGEERVDSDGDQRGDKEEQAREQATAGGAAREKGGKLNLNE